MKIKKIISRVLNFFRLFHHVRHRYHVRKSKQVLKKIQEIHEQFPNQYGRIMNYLKKVNPYLFEELILTAVENQNLRVTRNKSYSGDGGVDGIFHTSQGKVYIQCKRYQDYIQLQDVKSLLLKSREKKCYKAIFVHTGKTRDSSKELFKQNKDKIVLISGNQLIDFLLDKKQMIDMLSH